MCKKYTCPKATECYRLRASPNEDQRYEEFPKLCTKEDDYKMYMKIRPEDNIIKLDLQAIETPIEHEVTNTTTKQGGNNAK